MSAELGFIGNGNMGYAILKGLIDQNVLKPSETAVYDPSKNASERASHLGVVIYDSEKELVKNSNVILAAIKPQNASRVFAEIGEELKGKLLLSIVAGYDVLTIREHLEQEDVRILRIMPNTPALVGEGVFGLDLGTDAVEEEKEKVDAWLSSLGSVFWLEEKLFPVLTGLSGGGPAYAALFVEALADGGVKYGLKRDDALQIAAQTVLGSAKLILEEKEHPAQLKDNVCSPGGTTIEGVQALEDGAFRATVIRAVEKSTRKAENLS